MMLRFSKLIQGIFEELDDKSLTNCKIASNSWCYFIEDNKFPFIRKNMEEFKNTLGKNCDQNTKELAISVYQCFRWSITFKGGKKQLSPLHIAAERAICNYANISSK